MSNENMFILEQQSEVIGVYLPEGELNYGAARQSLIDEKWKRYIPLVSGFSKNVKENFVIADFDNRENELKTFDGNMSAKSYRESDLGRTILDVTRSDLLVSADIIMLNLTDVNITVSMPNGLKKIIPPIGRSEALAQFKGHILIMEVTTLNTSDFVSSVSGIDDYISLLISEVKSHPDVDETKASKLVKIYERARECMNSIAASGEKFLANSAKVINVMELEGSVMSRIDRNEFVYIKEYGLVISKNKITSGGFTPLFTRFASMTVEEVKNLKTNTFNAVLVDRNNTIDQRFLYIAGNVIEIPKSRTGEVEGLHIYINGFGGDEIIEHIPLDRLGDCKFVFKTRESALSGIDRMLAAEHKLKESKQDFEKFRIDSERKLQELKHERELERQRYEKEKEERDRQWALEKEERDRQWEQRTRHWDENKQRTNHEKSQVDLEHDRLKAELDAQRELLKLEVSRWEARQKRESDAHKYDHELRKADAENTLQTLKVIGGVAALGGIAYTLYRKFSS